jgi:hypothetical protein
VKITSILGRVKDGVGHGSFETLSPLPPERVRPFGHAWQMYDLNRRDVNLWFLEVDLRGQSGASPLSQAVGHGLVPPIRFHADRALGLAS